jgi:sugar O-acyltransferase (sialic acid O-acetyltransferase NeuD family)
VTSLLLVGAGGLAREVLAVERRLARFHEVAVLDDDPARRDTTVAGAVVVGGLDCVVHRPAAQLVVCIGRGTARRSVVDRLARLGVERSRFATVVDPQVVVPEGCEVLEGSVLLAGTVLTADVRIGRHVVVMPNVTLTHDAVIEDFATLCAGVTLGGEVRVGEAAYLGMASSVRERLEIGAGSVLGMAAALLQPLPAGETWAGVPARPLSDTRGQHP